MDTATTLSQIRLAKRALFTLDSHARRVVCESGALWITQDRDLRDILLEPGEAFVVEPGRRAILYALSPATLTLERESQIPALVPARGRPRRPGTRTLALE